MSKIKEQHKKLHSAEQILRAELAEKRQVLKGLRKVQQYFIFIEVFFIFNEVSIHRQFGEI